MNKTTERVTYNDRIDALAQHLGVEASEIKQDYKTRYEYGSDIYLVLNDDERIEYVSDDIQYSIAHFRPGFIANFIQRYCKVAIDEEIIRVAQETLDDKCNEYFIRLIGDYYDYFVQEAIDADGAGHFLNSYDGQEYEVNGFYIYQT